MTREISPPGCWGGRRTLNPVESSRRSDVPICQAGTVLATEFLGNFGNCRESPILGWAIFQVNFELFAIDYPRICGTTF